MSDFEKEKRKRKRIKLECLSCGSTFDDDYRQKHEKQVHNGAKVKVKHHGAADNPFVYARLNFERKVC
jgi:hypothetical protein